MKRYISGIGWVRSQPLFHNAVTHRSKRIKLYRLIVPVLKKWRQELKRRNLSYRVTISDRSLSTYLYLSSEDFRFKIRFSDHRGSCYCDWNFVNAQFDFNKEEVEKAIDTAVNYLIKQARV